MSATYLAPCNESSNETLTTLTTLTVLCLIDVLALTRITDVSLNAFRSRCLLPRRLDWSRVLDVLASSITVLFPLTK